MKIIDISWPISNYMTEYKNTKLIDLKHIVKEGSDAREMMITMKSHTGTHVDAPAHFCKDGKTLDHIPLTELVGPCRVLDLMQVNDAIKRSDLEGFLIKPEEIILLKTKNSLCGLTDPFDSNFIYLRSDAAEYLVDQKIKAIGIDYLGIERNQPGHETHKAFMQKDIPIIEGLRLHHVQAGSYFLVCLPLAIQDADGAPARAILLER